MYLSAVKTFYIIRPWNARFVSRSIKYWAESGTGKRWVGLRHDPAETGLMRLSLLFIHDSIRG